MIPLEYLEWNIDGAPLEIIIWANLQAEQASRPCAAPPPGAPAPGVCSLTRPRFALGTRAHRLVVSAAQETPVSYQRWRRRSRRRSDFLSGRRKRLSQGPEGAAGGDRGGVAGVARATTVTSPHWPGGPTANPPPNPPPRSFAYSHAHAHVAGLLLLPD